MAVKIRLKRMGSKKKPFYRMVAADQRAPRDGRYIEELGYYNPLTKELKIDNELAQKWLKNGAQPTDTARALLKKCGALVDSPEVEAARRAKGDAIVAAKQAKIQAEADAAAAKEAAEKAAAEPAPAPAAKAEEPAAQETPVPAEEPAVEEAPAEGPEAEAASSEEPAVADEPAAEEPAAEETAAEEEKAEEPAAK